MKIRYISDAHFSHKNIISYDNRPFSSTDEMNHAMIDLWNETVADGDLTYVLGDFCWSQTYEDWVEILRQLKGQIFVIKGNHDRTEILKKLAKEKYIVGWSQQEIVTDFTDNLGKWSNGEKDLGVVKIVLNHSPMPFFINEHHNGWAHLYGHVHISYDWNMVLNMQRQIEELYQKEIRMYNVGAMMEYINYIPRTLKEIEEGFRKLDLLKLEFSRNHSWGK